MHYTIYSLENSVVLVYLRGVQPSIHLIREHFHHLCYHFTRSWQLHIYFLSLWISLLWSFHVNGIIPYVVFGDWLLSCRMVSGFVCVMACISTSLLFIFLSLFLLRESEREREREQGRGGERGRENPKQALHCQHRA